MPRPRFCLFEEVGDPCASDRVDVPTLPRCGERFSSDLFAARWYWDTTEQYPAPGLDTKPLKKTIRAGDGLSLVGEVRGGCRRSQLISSAAA